jgi:hypothetical protein
MKLAVQELEEALNDDSWQGNRSRYSYMMGEVLRQMGDFHKAVKYLDLVDRKSMLPFELIRHQREMAVNGQAEPVQLPPHLVEQIFMPKPLIDREEVAAADADSLETASMVVPVSSANAT